MAEDFKEAFERYVAQSEVEALLAERREGKSGDRDQESGVREQGADPPPSGSGATRGSNQKPDVSDKKPEDRKPEAGDQRKDESGRTEGGEAAAA